MSTLLKNRGTILNRCTKQELSLLIGNSLEHFDTSLYSCLAPILAPLFFPKYDPVIQLILAYSLLSTSLVTRPLGAFIFGVMARHYGPVWSLSYSLIGVAIATVTIGFLPTYDEVGWLSSLLLILMRVIKGIFASGESSIAKLYLLEGKDREQSLQLSYCYQSSSMLGIILASALSTLLIALQEYPQLWRAGFWLGGISGFIGYMLRDHSSRQIKETVVREKMTYVSSLKLLWIHKTNLCRVALCTSFSHLTYTLPFVVMNGLVPLVTSISLETMMAWNTLLLLFDMLLIPVIGQYLTKWDPHGVLLFSSSLLALTTFPLLLHLEGSSFSYVIFFRCWIIFWGVVFLCPLNLWFTHIFSPGEQYLLIGMGEALGSGTLGKMSPAICMTLWYATGSLAAPALYVTLLMLGSCYAIRSAPCYRPLLHPSN